jgi:cell division protein FtsB
MKIRKQYAKILRRLPKRVFGPLCCVLVLFYLGFHAISGDRGFVALFKEKKQLEVLKAELEDVKAEREELDLKVKRLSSHSLDLDLLDERARVVLGMAGKNEIVYFVSSEK